MKRRKNFTGIALICIGALTLLATRHDALSGSNSALVAGLLTIVAGIWLHIRYMKHESLY
ncbi:MAG: hypothetical protein IJ637_03505 [Prevotella sp.]|nr:hypothetical protein [Prevotella sp.]